MDPLQDLSLAVSANQAILPFAQRMETMYASVGGLKVSALRKRAHDQLYKLPKIETAHAILLDTVGVAGTKGEMKSSMLNVFSFVSLAALRGRPFFLCMKTHIERHGALAIALYTDGVVPRNKTRPDKAGSFETIRFTLTEFPHWLRCRVGLRWIPLMYQTHDAMDATGVTVSMVTARISEYVFLAERRWDMATGILFRHENEDPVSFKLRFGCMRKDERAEKACFSLKGAAGKSPCGVCNNCMGRIDYVEDAGGFVHGQAMQSSGFFLRAGPSGSTGSFVQSAGLSSILRFRIHACEAPLYAKGLGWSFRFPFS